jgi:small basic protein (TIGR04137 family)
MMSLDPSLRAKSSLVRHRNVLTRAERIAILMDREHWDESQGATGLPKVAHRKAKAGKKKKAKAGPEEEQAPTPTAPGS